MYREYRVSKARQAAQNYRVVFGFFWQMEQESGDFKRVFSTNGRPLEQEVKILRMAAMILNGLMVQNYVNPKRILQGL